MAAPIHCIVVPLRIAAPPHDLRHSVKISADQEHQESPLIARIEANPAKLSPSLSCLFPPGVLTAELREPGDPSLLLPAETQYLRKAVLKRAQEFAAGRLCARRLLAEFGISDFPIEVADDRQPVWPDALVGSITHTDGLCAAVVAPRTCLRAVGLDSEAAGRVKPELWPSICVPSEIDWLQAQPQPEQSSAASLIFSAKEAFYKCQYSLVRERIGFHDVRVEVLGRVAFGGDFEIHATRQIAFAKYAQPPARGRYLFHEQFVTAGIALAVAANSAQ
jgi:4'-phosphopantetheinyl transferase EntD